jgi:hypothetical protein
VFLVLLLSERKLKETALVISGVVLSTFACLLMFKGGLGRNLSFLLTGFDLNASAYFTFNNHALLSGVGLFSPVKVLFQSVFEFFGATPTWPHFLGAYSLVVMVCFALITLYVVFIEKVLWKKVALLTFSMLLFPHVSFDYKLMHVFLPLLLFINSEGESRGDWFYATAFALLLIPKSYYFLPDFVTNSGNRDISIAVFVNPLIMVVMICVIMVGGLGKSSLLKKRDA